MTNIDDDLYLLFERLVIFLFNKTFVGVNVTKLALDKIDMVILVELYWHN